MKKISSNIGSSRIWKAVFALHEGEKIDLNKFSTEEKTEIKEALAIIKAIKTSQEDIPLPSKSSFNEMLFHIPGEDTLERENDWKNFFREWKFGAKQWIAVPVLGLLAFTVISWQSWQQHQSSVQVTTAEMLTQEIQNDFQEFYREFEEIESLKKELDLVYLNEEKSSLYF